MVHVHSLRRRVVVWTAALVATLAFGAGSAFAEPNENASCMGLEAEAISPPGSEPTEFEQGMREVRVFIQEEFGIPQPGRAISAFARLKLGTHEACDEAVGLG